MQLANVDLRFETGLHSVYTTSRAVGRLVLEFFLLTLFFFVFGATPSFVSGNFISSGCGRIHAQFKRMTYGAELHLNSS